MVTTGAPQPRPFLTTWPHPLQTRKRESRAWCTEVSGGGSWAAQVRSAARPAPRRPAARCAPTACCAIGFRALWPPAPHAVPATSPARPRTGGKSRLGKEGKGRGGGHGRWGVGEAPGNGVWCVTRRGLRLPQSFWLCEWSDPCDHARDHLSVCVRVCMCVYERD